MKKLVLTAIAALALAVSAPALAADGTTTFGGTTVENGVATLVANVGNTATADDFSGVTVPVPTGLTFAQITNLAADYNVTDDDCGAGSPRFQVKVGDKNVFVAFGPAGTLTGCAKNTWLTTGDLTEATAAECRVDTSQFAGGKQCSSWAEAVALLGTQLVQSVSLVVDSSWNSTTQTNPAFTDKEQTVLIRNVALNDKTYFVPTTTTPGTKPTPAQLCKAQRTALGTAAFNELWHINAQSNGIGKCVSATAKARNASTVHARVMNASKACKAKGLKGAKLGQCVAATDRLSATKTEAQEHKSKRG